MASVPPTPPTSATVTVTQAVHTNPADQEVTVISHSNLFYWWPVWAVGFLMGILSWLDGHYVVVVPIGSKAVHATTDPRSTIAVIPKDGKVVKNARDGKVEEEDGKTTHQLDKTDVIILPPGTVTEPVLVQHLHMARSSGYGVLFSTVLLLVVFITNVPLRGLWSVVVIVTIILLSVIFALAGWWDAILTTLSYLDIRINAGGYFFISGILFAIWIITMVVFDRQIYMIFTPGQLKVCTEIGGGERVFDTSGMKLEKQRSDLFRHWVLGLGSGDLIVRTSGAGMEHLELDNVLFIGQKAAKIENLMKTKAVEAK